MGMMTWFTGRDSLASGMRPETRREAIVASLLNMAWIIEARDPYTGGHLWRVSRYAALLGERSGMTVEQVAQLILGAFVHDLGKVGVPDAILRKREPLDEAEFAIIRVHPELGARMLAGHPYAHLLHDVVLLHHETPDGQGYPRGLSGPSIPAAARIVGLCDAFDAMTTPRPYRGAMSLDQALTAIEAQLGRQFDDFLGRHLIGLAREGALDGILGHSDEGLRLQACHRCGPTLVVRREHHAGEHIHCPACGERHKLVATGGGRSAALRAEPTGVIGGPADLLPSPDQALIRRLVQDTAGLAVQTGYGMPGAA